MLRLEQLHGTLPDRVRTTLRHLSTFSGVSGVEIRLHDVPLYNAMYRFDDQMLVTPYLVHAHGFQHPLLHLRRDGEGIFQAYERQFETIWTRDARILVPSGDTSDRGGPG